MLQQAVLGNLSIPTGKGIAQPPGWGERGMMVGTSLAIKREREEVLPPLILHHKLDVGRHYYPPGFSHRDVVRTCRTSNRTSSPPCAPSDHVWDPAKLGSMSLHCNSPLDSGLT